MHKFTHGGSFARFLQQQALPPLEEEASQQADYMLKTNLFNQSDVINPVKNYYYRLDGQITKESMKNR